MSGGCQLHKTACQLHKTNVSANEKQRYVMALSLQQYNAGYTVANL